METVQQHAVAKAAISPGPGFNTIGVRSRGESLRLIGHERRLVALARKLWGRFDV